MKFLIETGKEQHTSSWQKCQAKHVGGKHDGKYLYEIKNTIVSTQWLKQGEEGVIQNAQVVKTVYDLPPGTQIEIDYNGDAGPEHFIICIDETQDVKEYAIGTGRLRPYHMKGRYRIMRDRIVEEAKALRDSQEEGF